MDISIRRARQSEFATVRNFYHALTDEMSGSKFCIGWKKDIYPAPEFLSKSIVDGELFIGELDGEIASCMVLNHDYNDGYKNVHWSVEVDDAELLVIHALGVRPKFSGLGIGKLMTRFALDFARRKNFKTIRLDVLDGNFPAEKLYTAEGFHFVDALKMFYEDTGWTTYKLYEILF